MAFRWVTLEFFSDFSVLALYFLKKGWDITYWCVGGCKRDGKKVKKKACKGLGKVHCGRPFLNGSRR